jgi:2-oxoisovalerate dehydrogenase E1 component
MERSTLLAVYRAMFTAREIDRAEQGLTTRGEAFFHISGAGHEVTAGLAVHLSSHDWLHCHYRDKALLLARGLPVQAFFDNVLCKHNGSSRGRQMSAFFSDPGLHILGMVTPTGNNALQAVGVAAAVRDQDSQPVVYCGVGDGTTQQGEFLEGVAEAVRWKLPVLFLIQNNRYAISTTTQGNTFFSLPTGEARELFGVAIEFLDGRDVRHVCQVFGDTVRSMRADRQPRLIVLDVERLTSHTNADDQRIYRQPGDLQQATETKDPLRNLRGQLLAEGTSDAELTEIEADIARQVAAAEAASVAGPEPIATLTAKRDLHVELTHPSRETSSVRGLAPLTMRDALRSTLKQHLLQDERVFLYGEDIEDPKGDVFGVTRGLSTEFPGRVRNSPLTESTIVGTCIGRALAGQRPVALIQFADFLPLAYNQIVTELATIYWRTDGQWNVPLIILAPCGAYRPGLGPYHAQTMDGTIAHTPGLDVFMPSTAGDAAGMLRAAFQSERPTLLLYPKAMLNDSSRASSIEVTDHFVPIGVSRKVRSGRDLTLVGWGNTVPLCERVAATLDTAGAECDVIDLRSLAPWDEKNVLASAEKTARLIVVHEDNQTCGLGGEILATVAERARFPVAMRRVARADTHIPCNFANQVEVLPSYKKILTTAADLLGFDLTWEQPAEMDDNVIEVKAIGSGPSDEAVSVVEMHVQPGQNLACGDIVASVEASKSVFDITSPVEGIVTEVLATGGETILVGKPLLRVQVEQSVARKKPTTVDDPGEPTLVRRRPAETLPLPRRSHRPRSFDVGISTVKSITGSRLVNNRELVRSVSTMNDADIFRLTGIESRQWIGGQETAVSLAVRAGEQLLASEQLSVDDLNLVVCSTTSPTSVTPSMACQVLNGLALGRPSTMLQAFDINAACSGYLYALQAAYDYLQSTPDGRVLVVTSEVLSPLLNLEDMDTAILFGDAASATILYGEEHFARAKGRLFRPELSAKGEDGSALSVPFRNDGFIQMKGRKIFHEAVRAMIASLNRVCQREGIGVNDLNLIVPHQANQRILDAIQSRVGATVYSNIRRLGNTSSSSIPLCLSELLPAAARGDRLGLCAFGGGFTFGASILQAM